MFRRNRKKIRVFYNTKKISTFKQQHPIYIFLKKKIIFKNVCKRANLFNQPNNFFYIQKYYYFPQITLLL